MIDKTEINNLINKCRVMAHNGLGDGRKATIPEIKFVALPVGIFVGISTNPGIFLTSLTYRFYSQIPELVTLDLIENRTILIQERFMKDRDMVYIIGIIAHEMGHAFNVASNIFPNTEENACVFEIDAMLRLYREGYAFMGVQLTKEDLNQYFNSRMNNYIKRSSNATLVKFVAFIQNPDSDFMLAPPLLPRTRSRLTLFGGKTPSPQVKTLSLDNKTEESEYLDNSQSKL